MVDEQAKLVAEFAATAMRLVFTAQLAFAGQLISALVASGVMSKPQAMDLITKLADTITSPLDQASSNLPAMLTKPVRQHAQALQNIAADLQPNHQR